MKQFRLSKVVSISTFFFILALALAACSPTAPAASPYGVIPVTGATNTAMPQPAATVEAPSASGSTQLNSASDPKLGSFLVDAKGMTLYIFTKDAPDVSNCSGGCLKAWPPLVAQGNLVAGAGVTGKLGTITRSDGTLQVTYNSMPLYYWASDSKPGDTTGQGVGGVWFVAPVSSAPAVQPSTTPSSGGYSQAPAAPAAAATTVVLANDPKLGAYLVDAKGMTLYTFTKDTAGVSNCSGGCLKAWPPLVSQGNPTAGAGVTGKLGTITRSDGTLQVTYNGMPLYYWASDMKPGDTTGQGVGGVWFVAAAAASTTSSSGSGW